MARRSSSDGIVMLIVYTIGLAFVIIGYSIKFLETYTKQHKDLATDYYGVLADYVEPIMKKYKVSNLNKLTELEAEMAQKSKEIDTRAKGIYNAIYGTN